MGAPATPLQDLGKLLLRLSIGGTLIFHGINKVANGIGFIHQTVAAHGLPDFVSYGVYAGEVLGPLLVIVGLFSRIGGLLIAANMVFATVLVRSAALTSLNPQGGAWALELEALFFLGGLAILCLGAGRFSLSRGSSALD